MAEFDLIPADYHAARRWRRALTSAGLIYGISMALGLALLHAVSVNVGELRRYVAEQTARAGIGETLAAELERARTALTNQQALLTTLAGWRGGATATRPFELLDASLDDDIVLSDWDLQRGAAAATTSDTGAQQTPPPERLTLHGTASDNGALVAFVSRLEAQSPGAQVRIVNAAAQTSSDEVVFELEVRFAGDKRD